MKLLLTLLLLIGSMGLSFSQEDEKEEFLDISEIKKEIQHGEGITPEELCRSQWKVSLSIMQLMYENPEDNMIVDAEYDGTIYTFNLDGTFQIDATIDTDGTWELRDDGRQLFLYNNLRKDEELHGIIMDDNTMKWYYFVDRSMFYQYLSRTDL